MADGVGSLRKFTVEGISFRVAGDANLSVTPTKFENSMIPTSGDSMRKMIKRVPIVESLVLITNGAENSALKSFAEDIGDLKMSYTNAVGDTHKCEGSFEWESYETEEGRSTISIQPRGDWTPFLA